MPYTGTERKLRCRAPIVRRLLLAVFCMPAWVLADEPVQIVTGNNYEPFSDEGLPAGGMLTELVSRTLEEMGKSSDISFAPWARGYQETLSGRYAATFPYVHTDERAENYLFSNALYEVETRIFVRQADSAQSLADLQGRRLCLPVGYALVEEVRAQLDGLPLEMDNPASMSNCFRMLERERTDFIYSSEPLGQLTALEELGDIGAVRMLDEVFADSRLHLIVPRDRPGAQQLIDDFNAALAELIEQGVVADIERRHLGHLKLDSIP